MTFASSNPPDPGSQSVSNRYFPQIAGGGFVNAAALPASLQQEGWKFLLQFVRISLTHGRDGE